MKKFPYADEKISEKEILFAVPSMVIGVGVLYTPRVIAEGTVGSDGWIALLIGGIFAVLVTWIVAKLASRFPRKNFYEYTSSIVSKPIAFILTFFLTILFILFTAYEVRSIADISKQYLFNRTPVEVVALSFLLVVVYAVSGSRAGLFRLNMLFLPIILFLGFVVVTFTLGWFKISNLFPVFETSWRGYLKGTKDGFFSYIGFGILLYYVSLVDHPKKTATKAALGMCVPIFLYVLIYIACIGVFSQITTANLIYPTIELAKEVEIPGGFFERFESLFFVIWIMAIFNTTAMSLDIAVFAANSMFKNASKVKIIFILSPIVYTIAMFPQNNNELSTFGTIISYYTLVSTVFIPFCLLLIASARGVKGNE